VFINLCSLAKLGTYPICGVVGVSPTMSGSWMVKPVGKANVDDWVRMPEKDKETFLGVIKEVGRADLSKTVRIESMQMESDTLGSVWIRMEEERDEGKADVVVAKDLFSTFEHRNESGWVEFGFDDLLAMNFLWNAGFKRFTLHSPSLSWTNRHYSVDLNFMVATIWKTSARVDLRIKGSSELKDHCTQKRWLMRADTTTGWSVMDNATADTLNAAIVDSDRRSSLVNLSTMQVKGKGGLVDVAFSGCIENMEDDFADKKVRIAESGSDLLLNDFVERFVGFMHEYSVPAFTIHNLKETGLKHYDKDFKRDVSVEKMVVDLITQTAAVFYADGSAKYATISVESVSNKKRRM
jgi:hypothetical protein